MLASLALRRSLLPVSTVTTQLAVRPVPFVFTAHYGTAKPAPPKGKPAQPAVTKKVAPTKVVAKPPPPPPKGSRAEKIEKQKEQERAAKEKQKEKEKEKDRAAKDKAKEKEQQQKEKEKEKLLKEKAKEKEQQQKEKEKERLLKEKAKEKEQHQKEKDRAAKEKLKEKEQHQKEKEKEKVQALKEKEKEKKQEANEQKKIEKQRKSEFPSRPKSPYIYFTLEVRDKVVKEMPDLKLTEVMSEMGKRWTALPDNARAKYEKLALQDKARFEKELAQYKTKYPDPPKRAATAYLFFVSAYTAGLKKEHPDWAVTQLISASAQKWKTLSANEKKKYEDLSAKDKERYTKERAKFDKLAANNNKQ